MPTGYSGTPLAKKLGIKDGQKTWRAGMPANVAAAIAQCGVSPNILQEPAPGVEMIHLFVTERKDLARHLTHSKRLLKSEGAIWVSWPKRSAGVPTDLSEDIIREEALPLDLVDIKVCAVDEIWSGLKFVIRKSKRESSSR